MIGRYGLDIARAAERDYTFEHKFGSNPNLTAGNQTIWTQGGMYPWAALDGDAQTLYIVSTSASDLDTIEIFGLDNNWELQTDTVTMTGQTAVATNVPFKRIYRMIYDHTAQNVGTITARTVSGAGTVVAHIDVVLPRLLRQYILFLQDIMDIYVSTQQGSERAETLILESTCVIIITGSQHLM